jgi:hypothetical protein
MAGLVEGVVRAESPLVSRVKETTASVCMGAGPGPTLFVPLQGTVQARSQMIEAFEQVYNKCSLLETIKLYTIVINNKLALIALHDLASRARFLLVFARF